VDVPNKKDENMKPSDRMKVVSIYIYLACVICLIGCSSPASNSNVQTRNDAPTSSTPTSQPSSITGNSSFEDGAGDVLDGNYRKPRQKLPGIDLANVSIEALGSDLRVTFAARSDFPDSLANDHSAVWHISACTPDGKRCCLFGAKAVGAEWIAYISEASKGSNTYLSQPVIQGNKLIITVPQDKLPNWMQNPFKWWADSEWNGTWADRVPDEGKDMFNAPTIPFPK
jgi:hypothetical protein